MSPELPDCPVCLTEPRLEIDVYYIRGFTAYDVPESLLEEAGVTVNAVRRHYNLGHVRLNGALAAAVIHEMAKQVTLHDQKFDELASQPDQRYRDGTVKKKVTLIHSKRGHMVSGYFLASMRVRMALLDQLGRFEGIVGKENASKGAEVTNNQLNVVMTGDPDMTKRIVEAMAGKLNLEVVPKQLEKSPAILTDEESDTL